MRAIHLDGSACELEPVVVKSENHIKVSLSKNIDYSDIDRVEFDYFGAVANGDETGYAVIPRGVGCNDYTLCFFEKHTDEFVREITESNMPVYGVKSGDKTFLAVVSGLPYDYTLCVKRENGGFYIYPIYEVHGEVIPEDLCIEYFFLEGEDADYSGMARRYRKYRLDKGELTPLAEKAAKSECIDYSAKSVMVRIRCGWKPAPPFVMHQTLENEPEMFVACDFDRVGEILDEFKAQGIEKAEICLVGWNVKGHDGRWPQAFPVCEELGGEEKLRALIEKGKSMGYQMTCHSNSCDQYEIADIYDSENTRRDRFGTPVINAEAWSGGEMYQLCPKIGYEQALDMLLKIRELGFTGTHYLDVLGVVHPRRCYHPDHYVDSRGAVAYAKKLCELSREIFGGISSEGTFDFISPFLDYGLYVGFSNENDGLVDRPVPFWEIVYHGYMLYNPYPLTVNCTFKNHENMLKVIEYGGRPSFYYYSKFTNNGFNWMGNDDAVCPDDERLKDSVKRIKRGSELNDEMQSFCFETMEKHEELSENVYRVTYSNGKTVTVDYNKLTYEIK